MHIKDMQKQINAVALRKGWHCGYRTNVESIMLAVCELSEAVEEIRKPAGGDVLTELADCVIRIMDLCEENGWNLEEAVLRKHEFNKTRPWRHGGKRL